jgi:hypothetical protein
MGGGLTLRSKKEGVCILSPARAGITWICVNPGITRVSQTGCTDDLRSLSVFALNWG